MVAPMVAHHKPIHNLFHRHSFSKHRLQDLFPFKNIGFDFQIVTGSRGNNAYEFGVSQHSEVVFFCCDQAESFGFGFTEYLRQLFCAVRFVIVEKTVRGNGYSLFSQTIEKALGRGDTCEGECADAGQRRGLF